MRRVPLVSLVVAASLLSPALQAKFGMTKTRLTLTRTRPPEIPIVGKKVAVEVTSDSPWMGSGPRDDVRGRLEQAIGEGGRYTIVARAREADAVVRLTVSDVDAEVENDTRIERKSVKVGENARRGSDGKIKRTDVYATRDVPVSYRVATGQISARVEVVADGTPRSSDVSESYQNVKTEGKIPDEMLSDGALRAFLIDGMAAKATWAVAFSPEPVEVLLAVDDPLKPGNELAKNGRWTDALAAWTDQRLKGDKEAARQHNMGVAYEALAYGTPVGTPEHHDNLEKARECYRKAREMDDGEKFFKEPLVRIETSIAYDNTAAGVLKDIAAFESKKKPPKKAVAAEEAAEAAPAPTKKKPPVKAKATPAPEAPKPTPAEPTLSGKAKTQ